MGKLTKDISKLTKVPHPQSRKTAQLTKKIIRQDNRKKAKQVHLIRTNLIAEKYMWFKNELECNEICTPELILTAAEKYLARFEEELEMINMKHGIGGRRNRQHANREDVIKMTKANEAEEFNNAGMELPDLLNPKQFQVLKKWTGELRFMQNFKLARFSRTRLTSLIAEEEKQKTRQVIQVKGKTCNEKGKDIVETVEKSSNVNSNVVGMECN